MKLNHNLKSYIKSYTHTKKDHIFRRKKKQEALKRSISSIRFVKHLHFICF